LPLAEDSSLQTINNNICMSTSNTSGTASGSGSGSNAIVATQLHHIKICI
jgi:hypothetical protein